jgi:hypothetical protein
VVDTKKKTPKKKKREEEPDLNGIAHFHTPTLVESLAEKTFTNVTTGGHFTYAVD